MIGKVFITRTGYDPQVGRHVKDPYLGADPSLGACRPDIRASLKPGDHVFVISGKVRDHDQFIMGGFEVAEKISAAEAYERFPKQRLRMLPNGQLTGNIIVNAAGEKAPIDDHPEKNFERRIRNYIVGKELIALTSDAEIADGREQTLEMLCDILHRRGSSPFRLLGRAGAKLTEEQIIQLREWLSDVKRANRN